VTVSADETVDVSLRVNGTSHVVRDVAARTSLADLLRDRLGLTGTHLGCEHGVCGACTVQLDGQPVRSCIQLAATCEGADVVTVEGLEGTTVDVLREAFSAEHGLQCGYCTPGMLVTCVDILNR
jgi:carbon-monoxide dehydrogenase small subunit